VLALICGDFSEHELVETTKQTTIDQKYFRCEHLNIRFIRFCRACASILYSKGSTPIDGLLVPVGTVSHPQDPGKGRRLQPKRLQKRVVEDSKTVFVL
jgi:hypothetical protein